MNKKILIVEDDEMLSEIYQKKFSDAGFNVIIANNGKQAFEQINLASDFDLILLDLVMPEEDGFDILKKIKQDQTTQGLRVVIFSNLSQEEDRQRASTLGAEGFIVKSDFTPQEIVTKVNSFFIEDRGNVIVEEVDFNKKRISSNDEFYVKNLNNSRSGGKKILIVEDEDVFAEVFGKKLQEVGYEVDLASNGAWGIKKIAQNHYDLMILDILMPALDGMEVVDKIKSGDKNRETPIIVFSNSVDEIEQQEEILNKGVDLFLVKTRITPSELAQKVKDLIG